MNNFPTSPRKQTYTLHRATSKEETGVNFDARTLTPATHALCSTSTAGVVSHLWFTINDSEPTISNASPSASAGDDETTPSMEAPLGDFFSLGTALLQILGEA